MTETPTSPVCKDNELNHLMDSVIQHGVGIAVLTPNAHLVTTSNAQADGWLFELNNGSKVFLTDAAEADDMLHNLCHDEKCTEFFKSKHLASSKEPAATGTELQVCQDIAKRQQFGLNKYGVAVADNPLSLMEWLQHAYEESLDQAVYLKRAMDELKKRGGVK